MEIGEKSQSLVALPPVNKSGTHFTIGRLGLGAGPVRSGTVNLDSTGLLTTDRPICSECYTDLTNAHFLKYR